MKKVVLLMIVMVFIVSACSSNRLIDNFNEVVVKEHVGESDVYKEARRIQDDKTIQKIRDEIKGIEWEEGVQVTMVRLPDYKFHLIEADAESEAVGHAYDLWVSPSGNKIELIFENESKYVQLDRERSAELFHSLIGEKLN